MSQNSGGGGGIGALGALLLIGYILVWLAVGIGLVLYAILSFCALIMTVICLFAWNRPRRFFHLGIVPIQARGIICFGIIGAILFPVFGLYLEWLFDTTLPGWLWFHMFLGGYALGAHYFWEGESFDARQVEQYYLDATPEYLPLPPPKAALPAPPKKPFEYADWTDAEEL
jgi:MFS family permease